MADFPEEQQESQEDRIAWLRKRGVQVEIPGERRAGNESEVGIGEAVSVVRIPCDDAQPYEELEIGLPTGYQGDALMQQLRKFFASDRHAINSDLLQQTATKQFGNTELRISPDALQKVSELGHVESFSLDSPCDANGLQGVAIYLDEAGQLKALPPNRRASQLARMCGFLDVPFCGDVFVGRTAVKRSSEGRMLANSSFPLKDLDSSAAWIKGAETRNYELGVSRGQVEMRGGGEEAAPEAGGVDDARGVAWQETLDTIEIRLTFQGQEKWTAKQIQVKLGAKAVDVSLRQDQRQFLSLKLAGSISLDDSTWTLSDGVLTLHCEKTSAGLWSRLEA